jgi:hypothetical protein
MSESASLLQCNTAQNPLRAPFPWFGGKSRAADLIWPRLGNVPNYVEPFAGSLAVLLRRPHAPGNEIVNDLDCYVANAWRAMQRDPEQVAQYADWPVNEADLHARHRWLHGRVEFRERMKVDPDYFDARVAGFWIWGLSSWIGNNFCRPSPQNSVPHLTPGKGVARQLPAITGTYGAMSHRGEPSGKGVTKVQAEALLQWFQDLSQRLRFTRVCCGEWQRVTTKSATFGQGLTAVFLDPPYDDGDTHDDCYGEFSRGVSASVRQWAISNGGNPLLRIALCGYEGEHAMPPEWQCVEWKAAGGYGNQSADNDNASRERIWFSPHCIQPEPELF